jgi:hypothetical protein
MMQGWAQEKEQEPTSDGFSTLDVSHLRQGQYRVVIYTSDLPISATLNISR